MLVAEKPEGCAPLLRTSARRLLVDWRTQPLHCAVDAWLSRDSSLLQWESRGLPGTGRRWNPSQFGGRLSAECAQARRLRVVDGKWDSHPLVGWVSSTPPPARSREARDAAGGTLVAYMLYRILRGKVSLVECSLVACRCVRSPLLCDCRTCHVFPWPANYKSRSSLSFPFSLDHRFYTSRCTRSSHAHTTFAPRSHHVHTYSPRLQRKRLPFTSFTRG